MSSESDSGKVEAADYRTRVIDDIRALKAAEWDRLHHALGPDARTPFMDYRFLRALADSRSVGDDTGWTPRFLLLDRGGESVAAAPLFEKDHSYGEYVFDWAWADAYHRHGLVYYPKGLVAVPFTPVPGPRLLARDDAARSALARELVATARRRDWSSLHVLFPDDADGTALAGQSLLERSGVQFHWHNPGYRDFDDFLGHLAQPKRKKIRAERRKVREAGIRIDVVAGDDITESHWDFFHRCYRTTYALHHSTPYLTRAFFSLVGTAMPEHLVMFTALREGKPIAASLLFHDAAAIYGRYWGAVEHVPCLHFEASYYAPMEWAIARGLARFEGGAQGEHKMARGFLPLRTRSFHWLAHPAFYQAVASYLEREAGGVDEYLDELRDRSPLRD
ncbi:MAG: N-acetyltransferase [Burkholderiaceae bacterium]|nr:N-acetyltransferase [Burkholderiaceae bacterium]